LHEAIKAVTEMMRKNFFITYLNVITGTKVCYDILLTCAPYSEQNNIPKTALKIIPKLIKNPVSKKISVITIGKME
jgi:hypothetical protein